MKEPQLALAYSDKPLTPAENGYKLKGTILLPFRMMSKSNFKPKGRQFLSPELAKFENTIAWYCKAQFPEPQFLEGWVAIRPAFKHRVHPDLSNLPKSLIDGLVKGKLFRDDVRVAVTVTPAEYGRDCASIEIWA